MTYKEVEALITKHNGRMMHGVKFMLATFENDADGIACHAEFINKAPDMECNCYSRGNGFRFR